MSDEPAVPRCVLDCVVLLQAAVSRGPAFVVLELVEAGRLQLLLSDDILTELRDVVLRPTVRAKFPILTVSFAEAFLARLLETAVFFQSIPRRFEFRRDPDDEPYLDLAIHAKANYLVTRDRDLLDLRDQSTAEARDFRRICPELRIVDPVGLLRELVGSRRP